MHRLPPSLHTPAQLPPRLPLLQIRKLPQVMHGIQIANLHEPSSNALHDFPSCFQAFSPVSFPFEEVARVKSVGAEFEEAAELSGRCGGPEGEFLHERGFFGGDEGFKLAVESGEVRVTGDGVEGGVVAVITLVFPDVDFDCKYRYVRRFIEAYQRYHSLPLLFSSFLPGGHGSP